VRVLLGCGRTRYISKLQNERGQVEKLDELDETENRKKK
jgi:hypothetical protein